MDKFESMRAFTHVVEEGGFAAAARKMQLSRSSVNKLVINLENQLGVQLLYRTTRKVIPTDTGRAFYERCIEILSTLEEVELAVSQQSQQPRGIFKINAPLSFGISFFGPTIAEFMRSYPEIKIQLTLEDGFIDPIAEGYDLSMRIGTPPQSPNFVVHQIKTFPRLICASPGYLRMKGIPQYSKELKHHHCLHYGHFTADSHWLLMTNGKEEKVRINPVFCANNGDVLRDAAINDLGIVMLPDFILNSAIEAGTLQVILPDCQVSGLSLSVFYPLNRHLSTKVKLFTEFIKSIFT